MREAVGPEIMVAMDAHWKFNVNDAIKLAQALEPFDLLWLEDPVPPENIEAQRHVTHSTRTPICTGENLYRKHGYRELIEKQAARIIAPDIPKMGGLLEAKKVADHADLYYIPMAPHNVASPIGTVAGAHRLRRDQQLPRHRISRPRRRPGGATWSKASRPSSRATSRSTTVPATA